MSYLTRWQDDTSRPSGREAVRDLAMRVLAPVGRMALTNYLLQSVVGTLVFYGYGAGYWGMARSWQVVLVTVVFALQVAFSHWWLARYRFGPMEWLWRWLTYGTRPQFRRSSAAPQPA